MSSKIYVGTKAHALKGMLIDGQNMEKLAESASLEEFVNRLRSTPYSDSLTELAPPFEARKIELILRRRLAEVHYSLMSTSPKFKVFELYYLKYIGWDLKTALKAKALGKGFDEASQYLDMRAEELVGRRDLIVKVLSARDVTEAVSLLSGTEFSSDVSAALNAFNAKGEARFFDVYIDHSVLSAISKEYATNFKVYQTFRGTDVGGVGEMVSTDIDAYNVLAVLRAKLWGLPEDDIKGLIITPTYRVTFAQLSRMVSAESVTEAAKSLESTYPVPTASSEEELVDGVEEMFVHRMRDVASKAFVWQGLGPGAALALVKLQEFEVGNLATIAIGIEAHMDVKTIAEKLRL